MVSEGRLDQSAVWSYFTSLVRACAPHVYDQSASHSDHYPVCEPAMEVLVRPYTTAAVLGAVCSVRRSWGVENEHATGGGPSAPGGRGLKTRFTGSLTTGDI